MLGSPFHLRRQYPSALFSPENFTRLRLHSVKAQAACLSRRSLEQSVPASSTRTGRWTRHLHTTCVQQNTIQANLDGDNSTCSDPSSRERGSEMCVRKPFTILFCGRDAFSCMVFRHLYDAKGEYCLDSRSGNLESCGVS